MDKTISISTIILRGNDMVQIITPEKMNQIIDDSNDKVNKGKFMYIAEDGQYVCCDNQTGDAWTEKFNDLIVSY